MLSDEEIQQIKLRLEGAFKPLRCVAEVSDYKQKISFRIFDHKNQGVFEIRNIVLRHLSEEARLQVLIQDVRAQVQAKGFVLV
jgi:hypothetical protein